MDDYAGNVDLGTDTRMKVGSDNIEVEAVDVSRDVELIVAENIVQSSDLVFIPARRTDDQVCSNFYFHT